MRIAPLVATAIGLALMACAGRTRSLWLPFNRRMPPAIAP